MKKNKASATKTEAPKVASLERALSVLKVFETASEPVSLARIATDTGLYKSTILRLIASFEDFGYLRRTDNGTYALGPAAFRLGTRYREQFRLDDVLEETLREGLSMLLPGPASSLTFWAMTRPTICTCARRILRAPGNPIVRVLSRGRPGKPCACPSTVSFRIARSGLYG